MSVVTDMRKHLGFPHWYSDTYNSNIETSALKPLSRIVVVRSPYTILA